MTLWSYWRPIRRCARTCLPGVRPRGTSWSPWRTRAGTGEVSFAFEEGPRQGNDRAFRRCRSASVGRRHDLALRRDAQLHGAPVAHVIDEFRRKAIAIERARRVLEVVVQVRLGGVAAVPAEAHL